MGSLPSVHRASARLDCPRRSPSTGPGGSNSAATAIAVGDTWLERALPSACPRRRVTSKTQPHVSAALTPVAATLHPPSSSPKFGKKKKRTSLARVSGRFSSPLHLRPTERTPAVNPSLLRRVVPSDLAVLLVCLQRSRPRYSSRIKTCYPVHLLVVCLQRFRSHVREKKEIPVS